MNPAGRAEGLIALHCETPHGPVSAVVNPVGAGLEALQVDSLDLIERFATDIPRPYYAGVSLAPWPNRIADGLWKWEGEELQLEITEPARNTALHGLVADRTFGVSSQTADSIDFTCVISQEPGYPFDLEVTVRYQLTDTGLAVTMTARNTGSRPAPVAFGTHPFLCVGSTPTRSLTLTAPVDREVLVDDRLIPTGIAPVHPDLPQGTVFRLAEVEFDTAFGMRGSGPWRTVLASEDGTQVVVWQDESMGWLQVFLTDSFPGIGGSRSAIAIEPMTAPPNAFATGEDLTVVQPGEDWSVTWGIDRELPTGA
jgi:aldose 1-epimerase